MIPELDVVVPADIGFVPDNPLPDPILIQNECNAPQKQLITVLATFAQKPEI